MCLSEFIRVEWRVKFIKNFKEGRKLKKFGGLCPNVITLYNKLVKISEMN
jgi:hypothetical protein